MTDFKTHNLRTTGEDFGDLYITKLVLDTESYDVLATQQIIYGTDGSIKFNQDYLPGQTPSTTPIPSFDFKVDVNNKPVYAQYSDSKSPAGYVRYQNEYDMHYMTLGLNDNSGTNYRVNFNEKGEIISVAGRDGGDPIEKTDPKFHEVAEVALLARAEAIIKVTEAAEELYEADKSELKENHFHRKAPEQTSSVEDPKSPATAAMQDQDLVSAIG